MVFTCNDENWIPITEQSHLSSGNKKHNSSGPFESTGRKRLN